LLLAFLSIPRDEMGVKTLPTRVRRTHPGFLACGLALVLVGLWCARSLLYDTFTLAALPLIWHRHHRSFYISARHDDFDITFANYSIHQTSAAPYPDRVPPVLHHISLGSGAATHSKWTEVRQSCLDMHPDWDAHLWTDETADKLVAEHFPEFYEMWTTYRYPIQKIDALRYMVLYRYGGWSRSALCFTSSQHTDGWVIQASSSTWICNASAPSAPSDASSSSRQPPTPRASRSGS
jgi:hypothetical protein